MTEISANSRLRLIRKGAVAALAGFLIIYHGFTIYQLYAQMGELTVFDHIQAGLRVMIAFSLMLVIAGIRFSLWVMWLSIVALIGTQYWAHFNFEIAGVSEERSALSYLRGLIFPAIITLVFPGKQHF